MTDLLLPGERDLFQQPMIDYVSELSRLEVLTPEADLANIAGVDITLGGTSVTARATNVADIVNVDLHAEVSATVDGNAFPIGDLVTDNMDPDEVAEIRGTVETTTEELDGTLTAVEQDGRWYFSVFYTAAEMTRADTEYDIPDEGIGADGADSPEAAFDLVLDRIEALDVAGMIRALNPGEAAALQRYAPLFLDEAEAAIAEAPPFELAITDRQFHVDGDGDQRTVVIDGLTITASGEDEVTGEPHAFEVRIEGACTHATSTTRRSISAPATRRRSPRSTSSSPTRPRSTPSSTRSGGRWPTSSRSASRCVSSTEHGSSARRPPTRRRCWRCCVPSTARSSTS